MRYLHTFVGKYTTSLVEEILIENNIKHNIVSNLEEDTHRVEVQVDKYIEAMQIVSKELKNEMNKLYS
jgi:hypothetical protein